MDPADLTFFDSDENRRWRAIRGWLLPEAAELLYRYASEASPDGVVVEIGSFAGKSTVCIATACKRHSRDSSSVFAIDVRFQADFFESLELFGVDEVVTCLERSGLDAAIAWARPVSFMYLDALHDKANAYADFLVWDMMLLPGAVIALDDTAGFMLGPSLQVQAGLQTGAYELLADVGGVTFLRKKHSIVDGVSDSPLARGSLLAHVQFVSAWLGALDPTFSKPDRPKFVVPKELSLVKKAFHRLWYYSPSQTAEFLGRKYFSHQRHQRQQPADGGAATVERDLKRPLLVLEWLESMDHDDEATGHTLAYLRASLDTRLGHDERAMDAFATLAEMDRSIQFAHFRIAVRDMARLRVAQINDLRSDRTQAVEGYKRIVAESDMPAIVAEAKAGLREPFAIPGLVAGRMLREFNLKLAPYRILR